MSVAYTYGYTRLEDPSQQIRLLQVHSARDKGAVLTGTLSVHTLPPRNASKTERLSKHLRLPGYQAISYVWGSGPELNPSHEIILDGRRFPITENLHAALHSYRSRIASSLRFWVDAICINQGDSYEKSAQIPIMRDIYHLAICVNVWLGAETAETIRAARFIKELIQSHSWVKNLAELNRRMVDMETEDRTAGRKQRPWTRAVVAESQRLVMKGVTKGALGFVRGMEIGFDVAFNSLSDHLDDQKVQEGGAFINVEDILSWEPNEIQLKAVEGEDFQEMATLLDKILFSDSQYFNRMWTLQELCVADRGFALVLGAGLDDLLGIFCYMQRTFNIRAGTIEKITSLIGITTKFNNGQRQSLRILLALSAGRKSKDPRDRIYALEGLMKDEMNPWLRPDYTKSVAEIYANTARHIISVDKSLDVLCGQRLEDRLPELPSWVPDFRHFGLDLRALVQATGENIIYHASQPEKEELPQYTPQIALEWQTITVTGILLGTVTVLSDIGVPDKELQIELFARSVNSWAAKLIQSQEWKPEELEAINKVTDLVGRYAEYYQNSNRATFAGRNPDKLQRLREITENAKHQSGIALDLYQKLFLTLLCGRLTPSARCRAGELLDHMTRLCNPDQEGTEALEVLCKALDSGTGGRRLIISEEKQIGAGPEKTQKGDMIYVLMGCNVPVILRKTERPTEFEFVGECYLHGFMDGEALTIRDGDKVTAHEVKLV
jgi:hypothetical protein